MSWRKFLLLPTLIQRGASAPKTVVEGWEVYWKGIKNTGPGGDVLWDPAHAEEIEFCLQKSLQHAERTLPIIDIGCGNGRFTRALSKAFARAVGIDLSHSAVERARRESAESNATFQVQDVAGSIWAQPLRGELGDVNVFIRGVLHILDHRQKQTLVDNVQLLLGKRGTLFLLETAFEGGPLDYLEFLGAKSGKLPSQLDQAISAGLPKPQRFSQIELARYFPRETFQVLESGPAPIFAVGMNSGASVEKIPGFYAALRCA
jgi:SAM-dependent methyltransferase